MAPPQVKKKSSFLKRFSSKKLFTKLLRSLVPLNPYDNLVEEERERQRQRQQIINVKEQYEQKRLATRNERRMWYEYYIKPYSMVVKKSDLFYVKDKDSKDEAAAQVIMDKHEQQQQDDDDDDDDDDNDDKDTENVENGPEIMVCQEIVGGADTTCSSVIPLCSDVKQDGEDDDVLYIKLPALTATVSRGRPCVDATCALCIDEYEEDDIVVWSNLRSGCSHVFHKDCLMEWLTKGKKHCPTCRQWYVPGAKIDDQKVVHGESWIRAKEEMTIAIQQQCDDEEEKEKENEEEKKEGTNKTTDTNWSS